MATNTFTGQQLIIVNYQGLESTQLTDTLGLVLLWFGNKGGKNSV